MFYIGRFMQGLSAGAVGVVVPMYLVETLDPQTRGKGAAVFELLDILGVFFCSLVGIAVVNLLGPADGAGVSVATKTLAWKFIFWTNAVPSALFFLGALALPESPSFLSRSFVQVKVPTAVIHDDSLLSRKFVLPFLLAVLVLVCNQGAAVTSLQYYTVKLLQDTGLGNVAANQMNSVVMASLTLGTVIALPLVDRLGRRPLMIVGTAGVVVGHLTAVLLFFFISYGWIAPCAATGYCMAAAFACVCGFFGLGPGVVAWLILSEMMPGRIRAKGMSIAMVFNMVVAYVVADQLLVIGSRYGYVVMFFAFASSSILYFWVVVLFLPETKGKTLADIELLWEGNAGRRNDG